MNKFTRKRNTYDQEALEILIKRYGFKKNYIQKSIRGDRTGIIPSQIKKEYEKLIMVAKKAKEEKLKELNESILNQ